MDGIHSILVHLDGAERAAERLALARRLAEPQGAALHVMFVALPAIATIPYPDDAGAVVSQTLVEIDQRRRREARAAFDAAFAGTTLAAHWLEPKDPIGAPLAFSRRALYADLLVLGQHNPAGTLLGGAPADFAEGVLARCGRPAILVPYAAPVPDRFARIAIAWKETAEAARAVAAALPLLRAAQKVHVLCWAASAAQLSGERQDLLAYLRAQGVDAEFHDGGAEPRDVGHRILSHAAELSADLLVMGCYGHGRAREWLLGGASRTVLSSMTLPVLASH